MDNLKNAISKVVTVVEKTDDAFEDGQFTVIEGIGIGVNLVPFIGVFKNWKAIKEEYLALTAADRAELSAWFASEFDLRNKNVEAIIELVFGALIQMGEAFEMLADIKKIQA